jgi:PhnB protein
VTMPFQETFWAKRFGMCTDRFGIPWMVNCAKPLEAVSGSGRRSAA